MYLVSHPHNERLTEFQDPPENRFAGPRLSTKLTPQNVAKAPVSVWETQGDKAQMGKFYAGGLSRVLHRSLKGLIFDDDRVAGLRIGMRRIFFVIRIIAAYFSLFSLTFYSTRHHMHILVVNTVF